MKKLVLAFMLILACFCMIGCKDANNVEPPVTVTPTPEQPEIIEKPVTIEAKETTGEIGEPVVSASGEAVLTCEDSDGGIYTFKQQVARAVESSGTWEYSKNGIVLFSGTFSGDINVTAEAPLSSLNLTVTKAADESGKLIETTEAKTFDFDVDPAGTFNATIPAVEIVVEVVVDPNNPETTEETKALLNEAVDLLLEGDIDGGIAKIKTAYDGQKNDETKMYYALAELASISVDESVNTLLTENFGIVGYPSKLNSLLNGDWLEEYSDLIKRRTILFVDETEGMGPFYKCSGVETDWRTGVHVLGQYSPEEDCWYDADRCDIKDIQLDENGQYIISEWVLLDTGLVSEDQLQNATKYYVIVTGNTIEVEMGKEYLPKFDTVPIEGMETVNTILQLSEVVSYHLLNCNSEGLNNVIDNILAVFGDKFENAKSLAASMSNASVEIPAELFDALELEEILGKASLKVGKAELNVLVASMEILQGTFQWMASYDWTANFSSVIDYLYNSEENSEELDKLELIRSCFSSEMLKVRNENKMTESKESFIDAISMIIDSYDFLVGDTSEYPESAIEQIKEYGEVFKDGAEKLKKAIEDGAIFYVPEKDPYLTGYWDNTSRNAMFGIDFGKFFQAGYLSDIIEKDAEGNPKLYLHIIPKYEYSPHYVDISSCQTTEDVTELEETYCNENGLTEIQRVATINIKLDPEKLTSLVVELWPEEISETPYLPIFNF